MCVVFLLLLLLICSHVCKEAENSDPKKTPVLSKKVTNRIQFMRDLLDEDGGRKNTDKSSRNAIIATKASEADVIKRSVTSLRAAGDGGEQDMDKVMQRNFTLRTIKAELGSKFTPWKKDGKPRGDAVWVLPDAPRSLQLSVWVRTLSE